MHLSAGNKLIRKNKDGSTLNWNKDEASARVALLPASYIQIEESASSIFDRQSEPVPEK